MKKVLYAKYVYGLAHWAPVDKTGLTTDLNIGVAEMRRQVATDALTLLRNDDPVSVFPLHPVDNAASSSSGKAAAGLRLFKRKRVAYIGMGLSEDNEFSRRCGPTTMRSVYFFDYNLDSIKAATWHLELLSGRYKLRSSSGLHNYARFPAPAKLRHQPACRLAPGAIAAKKKRP